MALTVAWAAPAPAAQHPQANIGASPPPRPAVAPRTSLPEVEQEVMCPVCGVPLSIAQSPQAERERVFIRGLIDHGYSKEQVKRALVDQFGPAVLALPGSHGFDLAAYLVPIAVLAVLLALLGVMLPRWRRRGAQPMTSPDPTAISAADRTRLDEDLARFDR